MTDQEAVLATLEEYSEAYCSKDVVRLMTLFDDGDNISLIGTGGDEICAGRSAIEAVFLRNFSDATATRFAWNWKHVIVADNCAVAAITLTIHLETQDGPIELGSNL